MQSFLSILATAAVLSVGARGQGDVRAELDGQFARTVRPFSKNKNL